MTKSLALTSPVFVDGGAIPTRYTGEGQDISPPLSWSGVPSSAQSLALIVDDPDAPDPAAPKREWVHWVLYNISPSLTGLPENVGTAKEGMRDGLNDWNRTGYGGPMPPIGRHRYVHKLYALDATLNFSTPPTKAALEEAMEGHILARATLIGTYQLKR
ncbi:MAG: YbhB/YbcL family Raf kinase inhibitor-like protein [Alphaproteobacteria bacterium]|nr:YbhB/YbcL family Raf kinase inhibitor-like protein [Alphaproteobacteria bacterium]